MPETAQKVYVEPLFGWRRVTAGRCAEHDAFGLKGVRGVCTHTALSEPAHCIPGAFAASWATSLGVPYIQQPPVPADLPDPPHEEAACPAVAVTGAPCGYYAHYDPNPETPIGVVVDWRMCWAYVAAIGKTKLHETGFRAARLRVVALVAPVSDSAVLETAAALGVPLLAPDAPAARLAELGIPLWQVRRLAPEPLPDVAAMKLAYQAAAMQSGQLVQIQYNSPSLPPVPVMWGPVQSQSSMPPPPTPKERAKFLRKLLRPRRS